MNTQLVILFSLFALGSVMADVYYVGRQARGQVLRFQSASGIRRAVGMKVGIKLLDDTDVETETDTDTDTETEVVASPTPSGTTSGSASASVSRSASASISVSASATASASASSSAEPAECAQGQQRQNGKCVRGSVSGRLTMPGRPEDYGREKLDAINEGVCSRAGVDKSYGSTRLAKADTVTVVFVIYLPAGAASITLDSVTASLNDLTALLAAINQALTSAGLPTVASLSVVFDPSSSPTPSVSPSVSAPVVKADSKDDNKLSDGAIAGIVIGSVAGAALLVALIVFVQMRTTQRAHARTSSKMTAQAVEAGAAKGEKNSLNAQL